jgi:hypothetical protein
MVVSQNRPSGTRPRHTDDPDDDDIVAMGAHLLDVALTYERLLAGKYSPAEALTTLRRSGGPPFRERVLDALEPMSGKQATWVHQRAGLADLKPGMRLEDDVHATGGLLLLTSGQILTAAHVERLCRFAAGAGVVEPIRVLVCQDDEAAA